MSIAEQPEAATSAAVEQQEQEAAASTLSAQDHLDLGLKAMALKKYEAACDSLSSAVELLTEEHGELSPQNGDALILLGTAMLKNAIANSSALGGTAPADEAEDSPAPPPPATAAASSSSSAAQPAASSSSSSAAPKAPITASALNFSFGGDAEDEEDEADGEDAGSDDEEGGEGEKEDDLENAFAVLDVARVIFSSSLSSATSDEAKEAATLKLVDVHTLLGETQTESEQFALAIEEYRAALGYLEPLSKPSDRRRAELHMFIALSLDYTPSATSAKEAVHHAKEAKEVLRLRKEELVADPSRGVKGEKEIKDLEELMAELDLKIEEFGAAPVDLESAKKEQALDDFLKAKGVAPDQINNLNGLVKKKNKRKAEEVAVEGASGAGEEDDKESKKAKVAAAATEEA